MIPIALFALTALITMNSKAPELEGSHPKDWINSVPISLESRSGQVTVIHFWTFGCINCKRNLPIYNRWHERFSKNNVAVIGIHSPEFEYEAVPASVAQKIRELGIRYPVLLDAGLRNWRRWNQQFWPAVYLIDHKGRIRYRWDGEMNYGGQNGERIMTEKIEQLLQEALTNPNAAALGKPVSPGR